MTSCVVTVTFTVVPEHRMSFLKAVRHQATVSLAAERACRQFDVCVDPERPETVFLYEVYDDASAFQAHLATPHFHHFDDTVRGWVTAKTVRCWERLS